MSVYDAARAMLRALGGKSMEFCKVPNLNGASTSLRIPTAASACLRQNAEVRLQPHDYSSASRLIQPEC